MFELLLPQNLAYHSPSYEELYFPGIKPRTKKLFYSLQDTEKNEMTSQTLSECGNTIKYITEEEKVK